MLLGSLLIWDIINICDFHRVNDVRIIPTVCVFLFVLSKVYCCFSILCFMYLNLLHWCFINRTEKYSVVVCGFADFPIFSAQCMYRYCAVVQQYNFRTTGKQPISDEYIFLRAVNPDISLIYAIDDQWFIQLIQKFS